VNYLILLGVFITGFLAWGGWEKRKSDRRTSIVFDAPTMDDFHFYQQMNTVYNRVMNLPFYNSDLTIGQGREEVDWQRNYRQNETLPKNGQKP